MSTQHHLFLQDLLIPTDQLQHLDKIGSTNSKAIGPIDEPNLYFKELAELMDKYDHEPVFKTHSFYHDYEIKWHRKLGSGISGPVRLCIHKPSGVKYALKILLDRPKARKEVRLHWLCSGSGHVVRLIDVFINDLVIPGDSVGKKRIIMVMELMEGGELFEYITERQHFTEQEASQILRQVAMAVQYCHSRSVAHRDLKPENLLLVEKHEDVRHVRVKLADFGFAKLDNGDLTTPQFTPYYVAPQVLEAQKRQKEVRMGQRSPGSPYFYDKSCDMWSVGVILYIMLCGYPPFYSEVPNQPITQRMRNNILSGHFDFPRREWEKITDNAKDLIHHLLCVEASDRIGVEELLRHPWLVHVNVPSHNLSSPVNIMDKDAFEQVSAVHSEFLKGMRRDEDRFLLKPINKSQNKLLTSRKQNTHTVPQVVVATKEMDLSNGVKSLRELQDICLMPSPLGIGSGETLADSSLIESTNKASMHNTTCDGLFLALKEEGWDPQRREFVGMVNRRRLAEKLQSTIDHAITVTAHAPSNMVT